MEKTFLLILFLLLFIFSDAQNLTSISPTNSPKGKSLSITIKGNATNFTQTNTSLEFYQNGSPTSVITVNSTTISDSLTVVANISISSTATTGLYDVFVYDSIDGSMLLYSSFNVSNAGSKSIKITPSTGCRGQTLSLTIIGTNTSFLQGNNTLTFFGQGSNNAFITNSLTRVSATEMDASISIPPSATIGSYSALLNTISDGQLILFNIAFKVLPPSIKSVSVSTAKRGDSLSVNIECANTHFNQGIKSISFFDNNIPASYLPVSSFTATSDSSVAAKIFVPSSSPIETYNLSILDSIDGVFVSNNVITIQPGNLIGISPDSATRSQKLSVTIAGNGTAFEQGKSTVSFISMGSPTSISIDSIIVNSSNNLTANITIKNNAIVGNYDVVVYSPLDGTQTLSSSFKVTGPNIISVTPNILNRGRKTSITITGTNTHFDQFNGTSVYFYSQNSITNLITVDSTKAINATNLIAYVSVGKTISDNAYELRTYDSIDNEIIFPNAIVIAPPKINSITPDSTVNNKTIDITVASTGTNFTQAVDSNFSFAFASTTTNNIIINSVNALNDTLIKLNITITPNASKGNYTLNYSNPIDGNMGVVFTVIPRIPSLISFSPLSAKKGETLDAILTGLNTSFMQSSSSLSVRFLKQGISTSLININSMTIQNDSMIKINITLDSTLAVIGNYDVKVTDSLDGSLTIVNGLSILNTGISEITNQLSYLNIYPNPTSNNFIIELNNQDVDVKEFLITDIKGQIIYKSKSPKITSDKLIRMDAHELNMCRGAYFIRISTANKLYFSKLMIE